MKLPESRPRVRVGQYWKKKDIGLLVQITGTHGGKYSYRKVKSGKSQGHQVVEKDLWRFWQLI